MKRGLISLIGSLVAAMLVNYDIALGKQFTKNKSQGTTTVIEAPIKQGEIKKVKLPPIKKEPPFKVGDVIGYSEPGLPERYVGKVVLHTKWGDGMEEVGLEEYMLEEGEIERYGPASLLVDRSKNMYIEDPQNKHGHRIHKYNKKGLHLLTIPYDSSTPYPYVDPNTEEIFMYETTDIHYKGLIRHYSPQGKLIATYQVPKDVELDVGIYVEDGILYSRWDGRRICEVKELTRKLPKEEEYEVRIKNYMDLVDWVREEKEMVDWFTGEKMRMSIPKMRINLAPIKRLKSIKLSTIPIKDELIIEERPKYEMMGFLKNIDGRGNLYILWGIMSEEDILNAEPGFGNPDYEVWKYDLSGKVLAKVKMKKDWTNTATIKHNLVVIVDEEIYELWTDKSGCYVFKWSKEENKR
jgi:hypothetical protein